MTQKVTKPNVFVFVYGTLKKGFKRHDWMTGSRLVEKDLLYGHTLINLGPYPAMVKIDAMTRDFKTQGEIYSMPSDFFDTLQKMEEDAGYHTTEVITSKGYQAKSFVFASLASGIASWTDEGGTKPHVEVALDDDIPF